MKKLIIVSLILMFVAATAWASGGKEHGDKGKGTVTQVVGP
jgi:hypothetical protein